MHTFDEAEACIQLVSDPGVQHINGDVCHVLTEERRMAATIVKYGCCLTNPRLADTSRGAVGDGSLAELISCTVGAWHEQEDSVRSLQECRPAQ